MKDIYQAIWDADQASGGGIRAITKGTPITGALEKQGYVVVDERQSGKREHRLMPKVYIPPAKQATYELVEKLFNNYVLDQTKPETVARDENEEVQEFIQAIYKSAPMEVAREYCERESGRRISSDDWWSIIQRAWFEEFNMGANPALSGFEHVVVGEQKQGKAQGYHFWYKYYMDEHFRIEEGAPEQDLITFIKGKSPAGDRTPDVVTLSYQWRAFDYKAKAFRPLTKPIGGFWVGPSIEGLMAIGTVRFMPEVNASKRAVINGAEYVLEMYRSPNDRNIRTFYPSFVKML